MVHQSGNAEWPGSAYKDGDLDGFSSYIAFLPSVNPGVVPSQAGAFVLVNAYDQTKGNKNIAQLLVDKLVLIMLNQRNV